MRTIKNDKTTYNKVLSTITMLLSLGPIIKLLTAGLSDKSIATTVINRVQIIVNKIQTLNVCLGRKNIITDEKSSTMPMPENLKPPKFKNSMHALKSTQSFNDGILICNAINIKIAAIKKFLCVINLSNTLLKFFILNNTYL